MGGQKKDNCLQVGDLKMTVKNTDAWFSTYPPRDSNFLRGMAWTSGFLKILPSDSNWDS